MRGGFGGGLGCNIIVIMIMRGGFGGGLGCNIIVIIIMRGGFGGGLGCNIIVIVTDGIPIYMSCFMVILFHIIDLNTLHEMLMTGIEE